MKKEYKSAQMEVLRVESLGIMIPPSLPDDPVLTPAPQRNWRPGPGASYQPPAKIV